MRIILIGLFVAMLLVCMPVTGALAVTHTVNQVGLTFQPDDITIEVGDTIEWIWSGLSHTVTNGIDFDDPELGTMFDAPLDALNPIFSFTFLSAGDVPYLCRPHFLLGMTGIVHVVAPTPVNEPPASVTFTLHQNSPNPFNPSTRILFQIPGADGVTVPTTLRIFDLQGRLVRNLVNEQLEAGHHSVSWNGRNEQGREAASGVYIYRLAAGGMVASQKMTLQK